MAATTTVRDANGRIIAEVWGASATQRDRTGTLRSMEADSPISAWVRSRIQKILVEGGDVSAWLDQRVSISNEYHY